MEIKEVVLTIVVVCFLAQLFFMLFFYLRVSIHKNNQDRKIQEKRKKSQKTHKTRKNTEKRRKTYENTEKRKKTQK